MGTLSSIENVSLPLIATRRTVKMGLSLMQWLTRLSVVGKGEKDREPERQTEGNQRSRLRDLNVLLVWRCHCFS